LAFYSNLCAKKHQVEWTDGITVGSKAFIENVKTRPGSKAKGRDVLEGSGAYQLRESSSIYRANFRAKKEDIGLENTYFWDFKIE
jgi:hypothetical protein